MEFVGAFVLCEVMLFEKKMKMTTVTLCVDRIVDEMTNERPGSALVDVR